MPRSERSSVRGAGRLLALALAVALAIAPPADATSAALHQAAFEGNPARIEALLLGGADANCRDQRGFTPLMRAAQRGGTAAAAMLLRHGAQLESTDAFGYTALHWAAQEGQAAVARLLLQAGARSDRREQHGYTPLHWAAQMGRAEVARVLLERGSDPFAADGGPSPLDLARRFGQGAVERLMIQPRRRVIGHSTERRPIALVESGWGARKVLFLGVVHGDEPQGRAIIERLLTSLERSPERLAGQRVLAVPVLNPDGLAAGTRTNARGVDLNRNFPTAWRPGSPGRTYGGAQPLSEAESRLLAQLIADQRPAVIVAFHAPLALTNYDGAAALPLARAMAAKSGYRLAASVGYETPGSLGQYAADGLGLPIVTIELGQETPEVGWRRLREALWLTLGDLNEL